MDQVPIPLTRRAAIGVVAASAAAVMLRPLSALARAAPATPATKPIPSSGERVPVVGLGSWITFNVGDDPELQDECAAVMRAFFGEGGRLIDSSPMYGSSQAVIGYGLAKLGRPPMLFSADKVWISSGSRGPEQIEHSRALWGVRRFDLLIDFVQVTYNVLDREVEERILPLAQERGVAVITNRPFRQGALIRQLERHSLPAWASGVGAATWAQFILKFIVSHPAITCAIPATSKVAHVVENMGAAAGPLPDASLRRRMAAYVESL